MAPEQARGAAIDQRADLFSVGVMLWEAITGERLWQGEPEVTIWNRLVEGDIRDVAAVRPDAPKALVEICRRAMSWEPKDRYASATEMLRALEHDAAAYQADASNRGLGVWLREAFANDRARIRQLIEVQVTAVLAAGSSQLTPARIDTQPSYRSAANVAQRAGGDTPVDTLSPVAPITVGGAMKPPASSASETKSRRTGLVGWAAAAGAIGVMVGAALSHRAGSTGTSHAEATAGLRRMVMDRPPEAVSRVRLKLGARPPQARIFMDGVPLRTNPFEGEFVRDGSTHFVHVAAEGFMSITRSVVMDHNLDMEVSLQPLDERGVASALKAPEPTPLTSHRRYEPPRRPIDHDDPWAEPSAKSGR
jgi:serine/threonine-protein kinase